MSQKEIESVERHLYRISRRMKNGQWSVYFIARFRAWNGSRFEKRLSNDLTTAREKLREYEILNDKRMPLVLEAERAAQEAKKAEQERANRMTIRKFVPIFQNLPEIKDKESADRDKELLAHIVRIMGDKPLAEISRQDLFDYIAKRRGETLFRCGEWTKIPVKDGTIKNELSCLRHMLNLARRYNHQASAVSFDMMPEPNHRQRVLKDSERQRLLKESPIWLRRLLTVALETCLSRGDLLRLTWENIDEENGVITPDGGRLKTEVAQASPLTDTVKKVLADIKREKKYPKGHNIETAHLVFTREDDQPITGDMVDKALPKACKRSNVTNFRFHDTRHTAKTAWAKAGIGVEAAMLAAGHKSVQMHQHYVHLQKSDIGKAFGTAKKIASPLRSAVMGQSKR